MKSNTVLTAGNTAKLYCLNWIEKIAIQKGKLSILDLGCGDAHNFVELLRRYPIIEYIGVDPSWKACRKAEENLEGTKALIFNRNACNEMPREIYLLMRRNFDIVVSFSVLEHIRRKLDYIMTARECLKDTGYLLLNYDDGHFRDFKEMPLTVIGQILAGFGFERWYQSRVERYEFLQMLDGLGFRIIDLKSFNTAFKGIAKTIPDEAKAEFGEKWLDIELWLNKFEILPGYFSTTNVICEIASRS